ncbi:Maltase-glucoamylase, intestinal [Fagus crenata]
MASEAAAEPAPHPPPTFLEVKCKSSGKTRRFAVGTDAAFALSIINRKLDPSTPLALHIEAFKEGEEPIAFGPNSPLVNYGHGWHLHTLTELDFHHPVPKGERVRPVTTRVSTVTSTDGSRPAEIVATPISFLYIGKIILAFILIFLLGLIFTLALENLPGFILFVKSSM